MLFKMVEKEWKSVGETIILKEMLKYKNSLIYNIFNFLFDFRN